MPPARKAKKRIRILLADREGIFRLGLKRLFGVEDDLRAVAQANDAAEAVDQARKFSPDLIFFQAALAGEDCSGLVAKLRDASPNCKVVITASTLTEHQALDHVKAGASGVILKSMPPEAFLKCARQVMANEIWLPPRKHTSTDHAAQTNPRHAPRPADTLTRRQKMIISYLLQGWRNREIAHHLAISEQTVKNHLRTVYEKVGVSDRLELVLYAIHKHLDLPAVSKDGPPTA